MPDPDAAVPAAAPATDEPARLPVSFLVRSKEDGWIWETEDADEAVSLRAEDTPIVVRANHEGRETGEVLRGPLSARDLEEWGGEMLELVRNRTSFAEIEDSELADQQRRARARFGAR